MSNLRWGVKLVPHSHPSSRGEWELKVQDLESDLSLTLFSMWIWSSFLAPTLLNFFCKIGDGDSVNMNSWDSQTLHSSWKAQMMQMCHCCWHVIVVPLLFNDVELRCSIAKSCLTVTTLLHHARLLCPPLFPRLCSDSHALSRWCYLTISSPAPASHFAFNLSKHRGFFQWVGSLHQVTKVLEVQLQHHSFQLTFRVDFLQNWLFRSPCSPRDSWDLQHHSSKASILQHSAFFLVQLSHLYMTTRKTIALTDTDSRAAPMKSSCQNIEQKSEQGPASIHQFIENNEAGGTWRRSCTGNQNTLKQFYRKNNLVSSANEGPGKVPGLGRWGNHCRVKWDISTKSHGGPCLDPHPNKLSVKKTFVRQPNPKKSTGCAMIRRSYS